MFCAPKAKPAKARNLLKGIAKLSYVYVTLVELNGSIKVKEKMEE